MYGHVIVPPLAGQSFGATGVMNLVGTGDPNLASTDSANGNLAFCAPGSTYHRLDGSSTTTFFYVKTSPTSLSNATGVWTGK